MDQLIQTTKQLLAKYREQLSYLFFGVLTTLVNYAIFWILTKLWHGQYVLLANLITFIAAASFAYVTNKLFVFRSRSWRPAFVLREASAFFTARLFSFGVEEAGLYVAAYLLHLERYIFGPIDGIMLAKIFLSVVVVVMNYFFSKLLIFAKRSDSDRFSSQFPISAKRSDSDNTELK